MPKWYVTQYFSWTFEVEAETEAEAVETAADMELSGADLIENLDHVLVVPKPEPDKEEFR